MNLCWGDLLKREATYQNSGGEHDLRAWHTWGQTRQEAAMRRAPTAALCFVQVTDSAMALFFVFPLQQNDENNL